MSGTGDGGRVRAVIVEDEPLARRNLAELVAGVPWLEAVGEAADGAAAVRLIDQKRPDLVFLDVRMPELSGLQVIERIEHDPAIVFTTAFDRYAVAAFELEAIDYLIKPFGRRRFEQALARVERRLRAEGTLPPVRERARMALGPRPLKRLFARRGRRIVPVKIAAVSRFEAADDYVAVHAGGATLLIRPTLAEMEALLDPDRFWRVHRSHIVSLDHIAHLRPFDDRRLLITMRDGAQVLASRAGSQRLRTLIG